MSVGFKVYRGEDVNRTQYERFVDEHGRVVWARFLWVSGAYLHDQCIIPRGWTWDVLGWGEFSESSMMWEDVYKSKDAARAAFIKRFNLNTEQAPS